MSGNSASGTGLFQKCDQCGKRVQNVGAHKAQTHDRDDSQDQKEVPITELDIDGHVLVKNPKMVTGVAHIPVKRDGSRPICGSTPRKDSVWRTDGWYPKSAEVLLNHRVCKRCLKVLAEDEEIPCRGILPIGEVKDLSGLVEGGGRDV